MTAFEKFDADRIEPVVVGMMSYDQICIWRDGEPTIWAVESADAAAELRDSLNAGQIGAESYRDGYYRTFAYLDPESMVACFHTYETFGRFSRPMARGQFVELTKPKRRRSSSSFSPRDPMQNLVEEAVVSAAEFSQRRGDYLIVSGYDVDGPAVTIGTAYRDGRIASIISAAPDPQTDRWTAAPRNDRVTLCATLDPCNRAEVGELVWDALLSWKLDPWNVLFTFVSPIEQATGSLIKMESFAAAS